MYTLPAPSGEPQDASLSECGSMNVFLVLERSRAAGGGLELVTPPLDGTILPGVTRDTILQIASR
jgi:branched-subunit amino acid aminotransferase/4-amino-4-deoxychorismate lyase